MTPRILTGLFALTTLAPLAACKSELDGKPVAQVKDATPTKASSDAEPDATQSATLKADPTKSSIGFVGAKVTGDHEGVFETFEGQAVLEGGEPKSVSFTVQTDSVQIEPDKLEQHLESEDFFFVSEYPQSKFVSRTIKPNAEGGATHEIEGDLTLRGETKTITFPATIEVTDAVAHGKAEFKINRKQFGIEYAGMPDDLIKDDVLLRVDLTFPRT